MGAGNLSLQVKLVHTHYLYYLRSWLHMTVPRKITIHMQERNDIIYLDDTNTIRGYST